MAEFNNLSITNKGKILYAKAQTGIELHFTKMQVGSGLIGTQNPETLLALVEPQYDVGIQSITPNTQAKTATISGMINNSQVTDGVYICEIGLFAQDPDDGEILYAYGSAGSKGDYYASSTSGAYSWNYQIIAAVGNAANVTVELSNLVYDYGVINTTPSFMYLTGGNQKEINTSIDNLFKTYTTSNNGNIYTISSSSITSASLKDGFPLCLKINADSTGTTSIKINALTAILLKKANGNAITNLKANGIYTFKYNATTGNFILQGEGGGGTATPDKILAPYTATTDVGDITGTIPSKTAQTYTPGTTNQVISLGQFLSGNQTILGDSDLISSNILSTANIFGVQGSATIQSLGGIQIKSGIAQYFDDANGSRITITDLPFTPSSVIAYFNKAGSTAQHYYMVLYSSLIGNVSFDLDINNPGNNNNSITGYSYLLDNTNIFSGGFNLKTRGLLSGGTWTYIAIGN